MKNDPGRDAAADLLTEVVKDLTSDRQQAASKRIKKIAFKATPMVKRKNVSKAAMASTFKRDKFTCRFCGKKTIHPGILRLVSSIFPQEFPYHPHGKTDESHPAYSLITSCDHLVAGTVGGGWDDPKNLITSCWQCNIIKSNASLETLRWKVRTVPRNDWDGLTSSYEKLWELSGKPDLQYHRAWMNALNRT